MYGKVPGSAMGGRVSNRKEVCVCVCVGREGCLPSLLDLAVDGRWLL